MFYDGVIINLKKQLKFENGSVQIGSSSKNLIIGIKICEIQVTRFKNRNCLKHDGVNEFMLCFKTCFEAMLVNNITFI